MACPGQLWTKSDLLINPQNFIPMQNESMKEGQMARASLSQIQINPFQNIEFINRGTQH